MQTYRNVLRRWVWLVLAMFGFSALFVPMAQAGMVSVDRYSQNDQRVEQQARVTAFVQRDDVQAQLIELGVDPLQAQERVAQLSDAELAQLADLSEAPAGSGVIGALVLIFVVLLITDILGLTDVFTFVNKR